MPEVKDWITYGLALLGIVVTGIFSYLVWKATKESVAVAKASYELSESIVLANESQINALKVQYRQTVKKRAEQVIHALQEQRELLDRLAISNSIKHVPMDSGLNVDDMTKYFGQFQVNQINFAWEKLHEFINRHCKKTDGTWYPAFDRRIERIRNDLDSVIWSFETLINEL